VTLNYLIAVNDKHKDFVDRCVRYWSSHKAFACVA